MLWEFEVVQFPVWSAVVPTYGEVGLNLMPGLLENLERNSDFAHEVIIVDDGSEEEIAEAVKQLCTDHHARFIHLDQNMGFAIACNRGIEQANGRVVMLVNNDVRQIGNTLDNLADLCIKLNAGVMGCKLLYANHTVQHAGVFYHPGAPFDHYCRHAGRYDSLACITVINHRLITGALMAIHRNTLLTIGLLDENFGCAAEDIDYCLSTMEAGRSMIYMGLIEAFHLEGRTRGNTPEEKAKYPKWQEREERGLQHLFEKWHGIEWDRFQQRF